MGRTHHTLFFHGHEQRWRGEGSFWNCLPPPSHPHDLRSAPKWTVRVRECLPSKSGMRLTCESTPGMSAPCHHPPHFRTGTRAPLTWVAAPSLTHADTPHAHPTIANREAQGRHPQDSTGVAQPLSSGMHFPNSGVHLQIEVTRKERQVVTQSSRSYCLSPVSPQHRRRTSDQRCGPCAPT